MKELSPFRYFKTSPEVIRLAVTMWIRLPLSLRQVEGLLFERGNRRLHASLYNFSGGFSWYLFGPENRLQYDIAGTLGNCSWAISSAPTIRTPGPTTSVSI